MSELSLCTRCHRNTLSYTSNLYCRACKDELKRKINNGKEIKNKMTMMIYCKYCGLTVQDVDQVDENTELWCKGCGEVTRIEL